jgi:hypothetical protein
MDLVIVHEFLKIAHELRHMLVVRRNERRMLEADTDPVLAGPEFAGLFVLAPHALQQDGVGFPQEPIRQRHLRQLFHGHIDSLNVVVHLLPIITLFRVEVTFVYERLFNVGLGFFDPAGGRGFLGDVHPNEKIHIWMSWENAFSSPGRRFASSNNVWIWDRTISIRD